VAVSGSVTDPSGKPIAGARVTAQPTAGGRVRASRTFTEADGRWRFDVLVPGVYAFTATADGFGPGLAESRPVAAGTGLADVRIVLTRDAVLAGKVVDEQGAPVRGAEVRFVVEGGGASFDGMDERRTDAQGRFEITGLARRAAMVTAALEERASRLEKVDLVATPERRDLVLVLRDASIEGVVVDSAGKPVAGAVIDSMPDHEGVADQAWQDLLSLESTEEARSDAQGRFRLAPLVDGRHRLAAKWPDEHDIYLRDHDVVAAVGAKDVRLVLDPNGDVHGRVVTSAGKPVGRAWVAIADGEGTLAFATPEAFDGGFFRLSQIPAGTYVVSISGNDFTRRLVADVVVPAGTSVDLGTIQVEPARTVSGRVTTRDGRPAAGATVYLGTMLSGDERSIQIERRNGLVEETSVKTGADGRFRLAARSDEEMRVVADHPALGRSVPLVVAGGKSSATVDVVLEPTGVLEGRVLRAGKGVADLHIVATSEERHVWFMTASGPDGVYRFDRLAPGRYSVDMQPEPGERGEAAVRSGETATLDLTVGKAKQD
jgi:protocatechuate 3,4-dioxygenase beta subunit